MSGSVTSSMPMVTRRRSPPLRIEARQSRVSNLLSQAGWAFYAHSRADAEREAADALAHVRELVEQRLLI